MNIDKVRRSAVALQKQYMELIEISESPIARNTAKLGLETCQMLIETLEEFQHSTPKDLPLWRAIRRMISLLAAIASTFFDASQR